MTATRTRGLLVVALAGLALSGCTGEGQTEAIRSYEVGIVADRDGSLAVEETIDYDFAGEERHGIVRILPDRAPYEQTRDRRYPVSDITVESPTGAPAETEVTSEDGALTIRVGDPDEEITGRHTYVLTYRVDAVVDPGAETDRLAWNAVGTGWEVPVDEVEVRLEGPAGAPPVDAGCAVGGEGDRTPCRIEERPDGSLRYGAGDLAPGEGVTVSATYPSGTFPGARPVFEETFSPAQAFRATPATVGLALAGLLALAAPAVLRLRRTRPARAAGPVPSQFTPPQDARPAQLGTVLDGYAQRHEVTATLLDLAVRGFLRIEEVAEPESGGDTPQDWRLVRASTPAGLRPYEQRLLDAFVADGDEVVLSDLQARFGTIEAEVCAAMYTDVVHLGWFHQDPAAMRRRWYGIGAAVLAAGVVLTVVLALTSTWALAGTGVVLAGVVVLGLAGRMPQRTALGAAVREQVVAFREHLAAADPRWLGERGRVDDVAEAARADPRIRYLPHAVALGVAEEWAERVGSAGGPAPDWYVPSSRNATVWPALLVFSSSSNPALAPPASAGTGSTYVGGGAGGGGGGSW